MDSSSNVLPSELCLHLDDHKKTTVNIDTLFF